MEIAWFIFGLIWGFSVSQYGNSKYWSPMKIIFIIIFGYLVIYLIVYAILASLGIKM